MEVLTLIPVPGNTWRSWGRCYRSISKYGTVLVEVVSTRLISIELL